MAVDAGGLEWLGTIQAIDRAYDLARTSRRWTLLATGAVTFRGRHDGLLLGLSLLRVRALFGFLLRVLAHSAHDSISD